MTSRLPILCSSLNHCNELYIDMNVRILSTSVIEMIDKIINYMIGRIEFFVDV